MKHEEYSWTTFDGLSVFAQSWAPDAAPKAAVALVHGFNEHSGRYSHVAARLTAAGYGVNAYDSRGHGKTDGPRVYASSYDVLMDDLERHLLETRSRFPRVPVFLYGHSYGGSQVLYYALRRSPKLAGVIASSPGLGSGTPQPALKMAAARFLSRIAPTLRLGTGFPIDGLSRDKEIIEKAMKDPLCSMGSISVRIAVELLSAGEWICAQRAFPLPLLLMQGTDDRYVDAGKTIALSRGLSGDVTLKEWEGGRHELHNDIEKEKVVDFVIGWIEKHLR